MDGQLLSDGKLLLTCTGWGTPLFRERPSGEELISFVGTETADLRPDLPETLVACFRGLSERVEVAFLFISCGSFFLLHELQTASRLAMLLDATQHATNCLPCKPHYQFTLRSFRVKLILHLRQTPPCVPPANCKEECNKRQKS